MTNEEINKKIEDSNFSVFELIGGLKYAINTTKTLLILCILMFGAIFLPWTQNLSGYGTVTTINASERPQQINAAIDGRIKKWYVNEGDNINTGDTLIRIEEIKDYYLDTQLLARTKTLVELKSQSILSYDDKTKALRGLRENLEENKIIKLKQADNKFNSSLLKYKNDSALYTANQKAFKVTEDQFNRAVEMKDKGMIAQYEFENRQVKFQATKAKLIASYNYTQTALNNIEIARNEIQNIRNTYNEKINKASSELYSAEIALLTAKNDLVKQENQLSNLEARSSMYFILAPQKGFISTTESSGIGEIIKKGQLLMKIVPNEQVLAAEIFVKPIDIPLLRKKQEIRLVFDGWPSIVFSGWPGASVGTFSAEIFSIDKNISKNGKYRVLVAQNKSQHWPELLHVGSGVQAFALLNDVPIWYELWRQLNGFPANFYEEKKEDAKDDKY